MRKVLFFIEGLSGGGAEKVLRNLVNHMDQTKFDITVQTIEQVPPQQYLVPGIHYKAVNRCRTQLGKKLFSYWFRLCAELKLAYPLFVKADYDIEIAYLETVSTKLIAQSTSKTARKLAWVHCDLSKKEGMSGAAEKLKAQYGKFDQIVCVSRDVQKGFHALFGDSLGTTVLHNVIDEDEIFLKAQEPIEWDCPPDCKRMVAVGRLAPQKNFPHLLDACSRLRDAGQRFHLMILGEGPERESLEQKIRDLDLTEWVTLKGFCNNPYPYMEKADLVVCSSLYEGLSTVVIESLILGKPVVTTPCTGMEELLGASEYGVIAEDREDGLYESLLMMMESRELRREYGAKAKLRGKCFFKQSVIGETEALLQHICDPASYTEER